MTRYAKEVDAAQSAIDFHHTVLNLESDNPPETRLWHLLFSLRSWCNEHDIDMDAVVTDAVSEWGVK